MLPTPMQENKPLFVKVPFRAGGVDYKKNQEFDFIGRQGINIDKVRQLYNAGFLIHDETKEVSTKSGDRLSEMNMSQLRLLKERINQVLKERTTSKEEFNKYSCRGSSSEHKQRGLIRRYLYLNPWFTSDEELIAAKKDFYSIRDSILKESN